MFDKIIIGAGLYGLYAALYCAKKNENILVIEYDDEAFKRATYINQARVHNGYHYPRSYSTAIKSAGYFQRFNTDYNFCILESFDKIYATSSAFSWANADQFVKFCKAANIKCDEVSTKKYFNEELCDGAYLTEEYTYDAQLLKDYFLNELSQFKNVEIRYNQRIESIERKENVFEIEMQDKTNLASDFILNATYSSVNQIVNKVNFELFKIKYEICEIILCKVNDALSNVGITVMDGPFFSIMPFGKSGLHSLTSVTFTPHLTSKEELPVFECQKRSNGFCSPTQLGNCNECIAKPETAWPYMSNLARKYLKDSLLFEYVSSLFAIKPILMASEVDDSRPTIIRQHASKPSFYSVLSGKINTVYDLDEILDNGNN
jgi:hypothetical protein